MFINRWILALLALVLAMSIIGNSAELVMRYYQGQFHVQYAGLAKVQVGTEKLLTEAYAVWPTWFVGDGKSHLWACGEVVQIEGKMRFTFAGTLNSNRDEPEVEFVPTNLPSARRKN